MINMKRLIQEIEENRRKEILYIMFFFTIIVFGVLLICGTLTSGVHLVDDHEFWRFSYMMNQEGYSIKEVIDWKMSGDYNWRFRPLYYPVRVVLTAIFGTNLFALSVLKGIEVVLACVLIYLIARQLGCKIGYSIITVFLVLVGPQSAIWWKLGPQELTGTWLFALGILCLLKWKESRKVIYNIVAILLFLITSLYKESFIALIPVVMLVHLYLSLQGKEITGKSFWYAIKENLVSEIILGIILLAEAYIILFVVGTNEVEYIGINPDLSLWYYIKIFLNNFRLYLRVGQYGVFVLALAVIFGKQITAILRETKWTLLLACTIVFPQFLIYAKTGLEERYVIPWIYGVAYYFIIVLSKSKLINGGIRKAYHLIIALLLVVNFVLLFYEGFYFAYRGRGITKMFEVVTERATEETRVLTAFEPYWESYHSCILILQTEGIERVYRLEEGRTEWNDGDEIITLEDMDIILMYNEKDRHYLYEQDIDLSDFEVTEYNTVCVAIRK